MLEEGNVLLYDHKFFYCNDKNNMRYDLNRVDFKYSDKREGDATRTIG